MPRTANPDIDYTLDRQWQWPAWKFSLDQGDLQTTLHARFNWPRPQPSTSTTSTSSTTRNNSAQLPLQDLQAFHHDVAEMAHYAPEDDIAAFYALLDARRDQREAELEESWAEVSQCLAASPQSFSSPEQWRCFCQFSRTFSLDSLVAFAATFLDTPGAPTGRDTPPSDTTPDSIPAGRAMLDTGPPTPPTPPKKPRPGHTTSRHLPAPEEPASGHTPSRHRLAPKEPTRVKGSLATQLAHPGNTRPRHRRPTGPLTRRQTKTRHLVLSGRVQTMRPGRVLKRKRGAHLGQQHGAICNDGRGREEDGGGRMGRNLDVDKGVVTMTGGSPDRSRVVKGTVLPKDPAG